jgi:LCP family protein required for cell wall assembly
VPACTLGQRLMADAPSKSTPATGLRRSRAGTALLVTAGLLSLLIAAGSGFSIATIQEVERDLAKLPVAAGCRDPDCLRHVTPKCERKACNFLILGSDSRKGFIRGVPASEESRADTIMLVQVDAAKDRTIVLSIPRDLRVEVPGIGPGKINTAFEHGPDVMVQAVEELTGLNVNHYVQVNFVGFQRLVDALGGVAICIDRPMVDTLAGLNLRRAGCHDLGGRQALAFVRARHIEGDAIPDFSRIARQQQFLRALLHEVLSLGALTHLPAFLRAAQDNLVLDENMNLYALQDLAIELARLGQGRVHFRIVPALPVEIDGVDYLTLAQPHAAILFNRMKQGKSLGNVGRAGVLTPISPANITIRLFDADSGGKVDEVAEYLERAGFVVTEIEPAPPGLTGSVILWGPGGRLERVVVASYLSDLSQEFDDEQTRRNEVAVVIGPDFEGIEGL